MTADGNAKPREPRHEVDLSSDAIHERLDEVAQLYELGMYLAQARPLPAPEPRRDVDSSKE